MNANKAGHRGRKPRKPHYRKGASRYIAKTVGEKPATVSADRLSNEIILALRNCQREYLSDEMKRYSNLKVIID